MRNLYNLGIRLYGLSILIASLFNEKASKWRKGRKDIFIQLQQALKGSLKPLAWFHCASLGEFEQGRPVIEMFRKKYPDYKILLTFFSPSGYEARKDYKEADYVFYLPLDTPFNSKQFIKILNPKIAIFIKYEFWYNYLNELNSRKIPTFLVSARFRDDQYFFSWMGSWFRKSLGFYNTIFAQDKGSQNLLNTFGINNVIVCGDTRFDRVIAISHQPYTNSLIEKFKNGQTLWICGSTWEEDEKLIFPIFDNLTHSGQKIKLLLVPHDISDARIKNIQTNYPGSILYSQSDENSVSTNNVMILDKMGLLSYLYRYAEIAYVGGGFGKGIHNLPEAAVYGIPVLFGPNYKKFIEAEELIKNGAGFSISATAELEAIITKLLNDPNYPQQCGQFAANYILSGQGATSKIIDAISKVITPS